MNPTPVSTDPSPAPALTQKARLWLRPAIVATIMLLIILQGVGFQAKWLEQSRDANLPVDAKSLMIQQEKNILATGIPTDRAADYSIQQFAFISSQAGRKEWRVVADEALLFKNEGVTHLKNVRAWLYTPQGEATEVTSLEGKYLQNSRIIELFGSVAARLPDGFWVRSDYLLHDPARRTIEFPYPWPIEGDGSEAQSTDSHKKTSGAPVHQKLSFTAVGGNFNLQTGKAQLYSQVILTLDRSDAARSEAAFEEKRLLPSSKKLHGIPDRTLISSDQATVLRRENQVHFTMSDKTPNPQRFVRVLQPRTYARGRSATVDIGSERPQLHWLALDDDVLIKERTTSENEEALKKGTLSPSPDSKGLQYITSGRAEFDSNTDKITFKVFPQAYQGENTLTGDWMILHRETDVIEVINGNAFNSGE